MARNLGGIVWLTGLSGAGKSTLAAAAGEQLAARRTPKMEAGGPAPSPGPEMKGGGFTPTPGVEILDGDEIRLYLSQGLGYTREDRDTNVHRIAYVARLLAKHGVLVFVAAISPYAATRAALAKLSADAGHAFVEVYVNAPLDTVSSRDVKGLYKQAHAGEIANFTGVSDPYEPPTAPAIEVRTDRESKAESATKIVDALIALGLG